MMACGTWASAVARHVDVPVSAVSENIFIVVCPHDQQY